MPRFTATPGLRKRHQSALAIIAAGGVVKSEAADEFLVTSPGSKKSYTVNTRTEFCGCKDHQYRVRFCKHLQAATIAQGADANKNSHPALAFAARGWAVFPCVPNQKTPAISWRKNSSTDPDLITALFKRNSNIGIDCGKSSLVVIDVDMHGKADGLAAWEEVKTVFGLSDKDTCRARTPSGGIHIIYRDSSGQLTNSNRYLPAGLDVRGNGGYIVAPGSRTAVGEYEFINDCVPMEIPDALWVLLTGKLVG